MPWIKSPPVVFVASWFAGLLFLTRILGNRAMVPASGLPVCAVVTKPF